MCSILLLCGCGRGRGVVWSTSGISLRMLAYEELLKLEGLHLMDTSPVNADTWTQTMKLSSTIGADLEDYLLPLYHCFNVK